MGNVAGVMSSESGFQVRGVSNVEVRMGSGIPQDVGEVKRHGTVAQEREKTGIPAYFVWCSLIFCGRAG